jgi:hypothetical protein
LKNHIEKRTRSCPLWGGVKDEWIEGLGGAQVRELGVNSVTDDSSDVVSSVSSKQMGEGPGKGGGTDFTEVTDNLMASEIQARMDKSLVEERGGRNLLRRSAGEWKGTEDMGGIAGL